MGRARTSDYGNPFVGISVVCGERFSLLGIPCSPKLEAACSSALGVEVKRAAIDGSGLLGIFCAMNSNGIVIPASASKGERAVLKKLGLNVYAIKGRFSACGNNVAVNDKGAIANPNLPRAEVKEIAECLGVEVVQMRIAGYETVGAMCIATNKGFLAHAKASDEEFAALEGALKVRGSAGTLNTGIPFVRLCGFANSKGYVVGESTTGFEMGRLDEGLAFID